MDRFFGLSAADSSIRQEVLAGLSTVLTMSFIVAVNPPEACAATNDNTSGGFTSAKPRAWIKKTARGPPTTTLESAFYRYPRVCLNRWHIYVQQQNSSSRPSFWTFDTPYESPDRELYDDASSFSIAAQISAQIFENIFSTSKRQNVCGPHRIRKNVAAMSFRTFNTANESPDCALEDTAQIP